MKMVMIAALIAAQLPAAAAQAAEPTRGESVAQPRSGERAEDEPADAQAPAPSAEKAPVAAPALAAEEDEPKKRKSTGDKVLTGAAVILGVGALAVGALLVAIFVN